MLDLKIGEYGYLTLSVLCENLVLMKEELISICDNLEDNFDQKLTNYDERLARLDKEMAERIDTLQKKYPDDADVEELSQLSIGLRRTRKLLRGKLEAIRNNTDDLLSELHDELRSKMPRIRESVKNTDTYEEAVLEIQRETHTSTKSLGDFFRGIFMWIETPKERVQAKKEEE